VRRLRCARVGEVSSPAQHLFPEGFRRRLPPQAFSGCSVEPIAELFQLPIANPAHVEFTRKPSAGPTVGVLNRAFLPGCGGIAEPGLRPDLGLEMWPPDELRPAVKGDRPTRMKGKVTDGLDNLAENKTGFSVVVLQEHGEPGNAFDQRGDIARAKALFEQHQIAFPMSELRPVRHDVWSEQDADVAMKFWRQALPGTPGLARFAMSRQIPPQFLGHAFLRVDVAVDRFLTDAAGCTFIAHPASNLFRSPAILDPSHDETAQIRMLDQFALAGPAFGAVVMRSHGKVTNDIGQLIIAKMIAPEFSENGRSMAPQGLCDFPRWHVCLPPTLNSAALIEGEVAVVCSDDIILLCDNLLVSNRSRTWE